LAKITHDQQPTTKPKICSNLTAQLKSNCNKYNSAKIRTETHLCKEHDPNLVKTYCSCSTWRRITAEIKWRVAEQDIFWLEIGVNQPMIMTDCQLIHHRHVKTFMLHW